MDWSLCDKLAGGHVALGWRVDGGNTTWNQTRFWTSASNCACRSHPLPMTPFNATHRKTSIP